MNTRLGFHYFEDQDHYQAKDLDLWLQELISLNANWLVLKASTNQAIPEEFITKLGRFWDPTGYPLRLPG